jgi:hypothetical protein
MKTDEHMRLDAHCEALHKALDKISAVMPTPRLTLPEARRRIAQIIVKVRKPD